MSKVYGNKELIGDSGCPKCMAQGKDVTQNHLQHWRNTETSEEWTFCNRCGHHEKITDDNRSNMESIRKVREELSAEQLKVVLDEALELPIKALTSRGVRMDVAERFGVRVGLSATDGETVISHFYPKKKEGELVAFKVRSLDPKYFYAVGNGSGCDFFGKDQAQKGDVYTRKLFIFEDELSAMSGYQALIDSSNGTIRPACVSLPDGAGSITTVMSRERKWLDSFDEIVVCMDNDEAGETAATQARQLYPTKVKIARITKGKTREGKEIKDANDLLMEGRILELNNLLRFKAAKENPAGAVSIADCIEEALKKPEWGFLTPWDGFNKLTYGLRLGEIIAIGAGVSLGKTLLAHELAAHLVTKLDQKVGCFLLEETVGDSVRNIAGKVAEMPFHRPDYEYDPKTLYDTAMELDGKCHLYSNFGTNDWNDIKQVIRFWRVEHDVRWIFLDNITALAGHLTPSEANTEIAKVASELAGMCQELEITVFVFSHLNAPSSGDAHENGGIVKEVQFTGSRALMRWSQLIIGFERNKQAEGDAKNYSLIRLLKDRKYGGSGITYTKYDPMTGRLTEREEHEVNKDDPFALTNGMGDVDLDDGYGDDNETLF